jgi:hypothetical protein
VALSALIPACLAALSGAGAGNVADAAHDAGVARVLGLDPQPWRTLERLPQLALIALPLGTRAARAAVGGALAIAVAGAAMLVLARRLLRLCSRASIVSSLVAAIAAMSAVVAPCWLGEAGAGGSGLGGVLAVAPLLSVMDVSARRWRWAAFFASMALADDPPAGLCAVVAAGVAVATDPATRRSLAGAWSQERGALGVWAAAGAAPGLLGLVHARLAGASTASIVAGLFGETPGTSFASSAASAMLFLRDALGPMQATLAVVGAVLGLLFAQARPIVLGLLALVILGPLCGSASTARVAAPGLAAFAAACALGAIALQAAVRAVAGANVPFARASAAMVMVLELAIPVDSADEALLRPRFGPDAALWDELAWDPLPPRAVVLLSSPRVGLRALAARAQGSLRDDVVLVPTYALSSHARRALSRDAALMPLWRDLELEGVPGGASLSALATTRALAMAYEPRWGKELGRHLVPLGLLDLFQPEPRGASDRRKGLASFRRLRERLAVAAQNDSELAETTAILLRARAWELASGGDRDLVGSALEDLHAFAPGDAAGAEIVGHVVLGK